MRKSSLALRLTVSALVASLVALIAAAIVISGLLRNFVEESHTQALDATMLAIMANIEFDETSGQAVLRVDAPDPRFKQPFSGWYWMVSVDDTVVFRSASLWAADIELGGSQAMGPMGEPLFARQRSFTIPGGTQPLQVVATAPQSAIDTELAGIITPLLLALAALAIGLAFTQWVQIGIGLQPLRRLGNNLAAISNGTIDALPDERYREIAPVVVQMNQLLTSNQETLRRAREHAGNLAHALKTPLAVLDTELARPATADGRNEALADASRTIERHISHHLRRARAAGPPAAVRTRVAVLPVITDLLPVFRAVYADRQLQITSTIAPEATFRGDRHDLEEMLGNVIDNACKWSRTSVSVSARSGVDGQLLVTILDDGPGMAEDQLQRAGARGLRFDQQRPGTGLGLAIAMDIAALYGGTLDLANVDDGGLRVELRLPD